MNLDLLIPQPPPEAPGFRMGTVTALNPLRVRLDGDTSPVGSTPITVVHGLQVGNRVLTLLYHRSLTVIGVIGGVQQVPSGSVQPFAGSAAPTGWLLCDGSAVSRTTYADLFAVIGTSYGSGDGSTTFNLPNLKGRVPVGRDASQVEFDTLGETGGAKTNTHNHYTATSNDGTNVYTSTTANVPRSRVVTKARYAGVGGGASGGTREDSTYDETINIVQPYVVLNYLIKI